ncbi:MAG TPA: fibronectin type III domain-containing protein [Noviherbaspirillum sp.]|nr:fibronectin type III domain-containing protein [Noviherbaspirillum sp.]
MTGSIPYGRRMGGRIPTILAASLSSVILHAQAAVTLPAYNVDPAQTSVSGLSSGGFMAVQLHVAYSSLFKAGAGIVAGGPFYCAQGNLSTATGPCMAATSTSKPATSTLISTTNSWASQGLIDPTSNLANSKVYLYSGTIDSTVKQLVMNEAHNYYKNYVNAANIFYKNNVASEHAMVTDYFGSSCSVKASPYINNCNFDLAGEMLKWIYGPLNAKNTGTLSGTFVEFNQTDFIANPPSHGMANTGWLYVPASCGSNQACKLHVAVHGCQQDPTKIQDKYYRNTGYNKWADTNNIIVLYPQTAPSSTGNPNGCWDWWGYDDPNYAKKSGRQMVAIKGMVDKITGGYVALPAPTNLHATGSTDTSISLAWNSVSGAAGYNVYRMGSKVNSSPVTGTTYTDAGLLSGTSYTYTVRAVTSSGATSQDSASVTTSTTGNPPPLATPANLAVSGRTSSSVSLTWSAASGAAGYNVYRNGTKVTASPVAATNYTDSGLASNTTYNYAVSSVSSGRESALSASVSATTLSACTQTTSSNYAHVTAGRAYASGGYAYAKGSNQNMGLNNTFYTTTLAQTSPGFYVIGNCP